MAKIHIGAALQAIADKHVDTLSPREVGLIYAAAAKLWDMPPFLIDAAELVPSPLPKPGRR